MNVGRDVFFSPGGMEYASNFGHEKGPSQNATCCFEMGHVLKPVLGIAAWASWIRVKQIHDFKKKKTGLPAARDF